MKILHWLLPSKKNKYHPHALRPVGLLIVLAVLIIIPPLYNAVSAQTFQVLGYATSISVSGLSNATNNYRTNSGTDALRLNTELSNAAIAKAKDMFADNYWAHVAPDGTTPWSFIVAAGYDYTAAGENLAKGFYASGDVVDAWMASQTHKENLLNSEYKEVGYAIVNGVLKGDEVTLVVAMYGTAYVPPVAQKAADTPTAATKSTPKNAEPESTNPTTTIVKKKDSPAKAADAPLTATEDQAATGSTSTREFGQVLGSAFMVPIKAYQSLNWGQKASVLIVCSLILLFIMKHTLIWRQQRRGFKHIWLRSHPIGQGAMLVAVLVLTLVSGAGVVL